MVLRGYKDGDLESMYALDVVCFERPFRFSRRAMREFAEADRARVILAEEGTALAGFVILHVEEIAGARAGYVITLDVQPAFRRRGLARALMQAAEQQAYIDGCTTVVLHVFSKNEVAMKFYAHMGFVRSHLEENFYGTAYGPERGRGMDAWVYYKELKATGA